MTTLTVQERTAKREKLKELTNKIKKLLATDVRYRENDALLVNRMQRDEMIDQGFDVNVMSLNDFFRIRLEKKVSSGDSITRIRREVQEYYPETRGDNYKKRQSKQIDVQSDLHEVENHIISNIQSPGAPTLIDRCDHCQGSGKYESYPCNICNGTGEVQVK